MAVVFSDSPIRLSLNNKSYKNAYKSDHRNVIRLVSLSSLWYWTSIFQSRDTLLNTVNVTSNLSRTQWGCLRNEGGFRFSWGTWPDPAVLVHARCSAAGLRAQGVLAFVCSWAWCLLASKQGAQCSGCGDADLYVEMLKQLVISGTRLNLEIIHFLGLNFL